MRIDEANMMVDAERKRCASLMSLTMDQVHVMVGEMSGPELIKLAIVLQNLQEKIRNPE
jgi:hypothetical protein